MIFSYFFVGYSVVLKNHTINRAFCCRNVVTSQRGFATTLRNGLSRGRKRLHSLNVAAFHQIHHINMQISLKNATVCQGGKTLLTGINFQADKGEYIYIIGKVGSGKSSLLKTLYGELPVEAEEAEVLGMALTALKRRCLPDLRRRLGIVFQDFQLLSDRTVGENLRFVLKATGWKKADREQRIAEVLEIVELTESADKFPHELSGGEQQRICIARALLNSPEVILADEPTGNLDADTGIKIARLLRSLTDRGTCVVFVTHNLALLQQVPGIVYSCENGTLCEVTERFNRPLDIGEV